jgi:protocatechuate 3,4-dioxygenase beta subunit
MLLSRRQFLHLSAAGGALAGAAACGGSSPGGDPDAALPGPDGPLPGPDADPACQATQADAVGPFFEPGAPMRVMIADANEPGERLLIMGQVLGADCVTPVAGVHIEVWQADRDGAYHTAAEQYRLRGWVTTDPTGAFMVDTIMPGSYVQGTGPRPAHLHFTFTHPDHRPVTTQIYFAGDPYLQPNDSCPSCGSDDPERILDRTGDAVAGWQATLRVKLAAA